MTRYRFLRLKWKIYAALLRWVKKAENDAYIAANDESWKVIKT